MAPADLPDPKTPHDRYFHDLAMTNRAILAHLRGDAPDTDGTVPLTEPAGQFDPSDHSVDEVQAYLADADDAERDRVLAAEKAGKGRKSLAG